MARVFPQPIRIASALVGPGNPVWILAEAGVNHNGDPRLAFELVARGSRQQVPMP